jgi:predicted transcriptional regulator
MADTVKRSFNVPNDLHDRIERIASKEDRTVNAQVVRWLEQKVREYEASEQSSGQWMPALAAA